MVTGQGVLSVQTGHDSVVGQGGGGVVEGQVGQVTVGQGGGGVVRGQLGHVVVGGHVKGGGVGGQIGMGWSLERI